MFGASTADGGKSFQFRNTCCENEYFLILSLLDVLYCFSLCPRLLWALVVKKSSLFMSSVPISMFYKAYRLIWFLHHSANMLAEFQSAIKRYS